MLLQPLPFIRSFILFFSCISAISKLQIVTVAIDLFDMPNQPNSVDNRRVSLVCPDAIERKKKVSKRAMKNPV